MTGFSDFVQASSSEAPPPSGVSATGVPNWNTSGQPSSFAAFVRPPTTEWGGETKERPPSHPEKSTFTKGIQSTAGVLDFLWGVVPGAAQVGLESGIGMRLLAEGKPREDAVREASQRAASSVEKFQDPFKKLISFLGYGDDYSETNVEKAKSWLGKKIEGGAEAVEKATNGAIMREQAVFLFNTLTTLGPGEIVSAVTGRAPKGARAGETPKTVEPKAVEPEAPPAAAPVADDFIKRMDKESAEIAKEVKPEEAALSIPAGKPRIKLKSQEVAKPPAAEEPILKEEEPAPAPARPFEDQSKWDTPRLERIAAAAKERLDEAQARFEESKANDQRLHKKSWQTPEYKEYAQRLEGELKMIREELESRKSQAIPSKLPVPASQAGRAEPKHLARVAALSAGAAAGAVLADDDHKVSGAIAGAVGGAMLAAFAPRMFARTEGGVQARELASSLARLVGRQTAKQIELLKFARSIPKDYFQHAEQIYRAIEDPSIQLSPRAAELKAKYVDPIMRLNSLIRAALKKLGVDVGEDVDAYVHRILKGKPSIFEAFERTNPQARTFSQFAPPLEERTVFKLTDPETGDKFYGVKDEKGQGYKVYHDKKIVGSGKISPKLWKEGKVPLGGKTMLRSQATTAELELHTPLEYYHDALASAIASNARLSRIRNNNVFLKNFIESPETKEIALKTDAPKDWREIPEIPQLREYKFVPRVANVLQDFASLPGEDLGEGIAKVSRIMTGSLFWNPLPHIFNVLDHSIVQRGLVSGWLNPAAYPRLMRTTLKAAKAVTEQNEDYLRFVKEGAGLMYPNVLLSDFSAKVLEQLGHQADMGPVAKAWGYVNPADMVRHIYSFSRKSLWSVNDILMMQAYLEKEMVKPETAIAEVEKHIPNYRVPDQVLGSRIISQALRSPILTAFGRYDYGRMRSYGELVRDLVGRDRTIKDRGKALDQIAMLSVMGMVVYSLVLDSIARQITGNPNAEATRFGASGIPYLLYSWAHGKKSGSQVLGSSFPMGMALKLGVEIASNRDLYTGRHLFETSGDIAQYLARQLSPISTAARIESGSLTPEQFIESSVGIRNPPTPQQRAEITARQRRARGEVAAQQRRERIRKHVDQLLGR